MIKYVPIVALLFCACTPDKSQNAPQTPAKPSVITSKTTATTAKKILNPATLASGITPIDPSEYDYPFAIDSVVVDNYANAYAITPAQAQHSMVLAMAAPEALTKVIDQIQGHYMGHSLIDGKDMTLVIYTDGEVAPMAFDYVLSEFGRGLVLPVKVTQAPSD